jgi:quercetin dioxygenase-like cupin family protein
MHSSGKSLLALAALSSLISQACGSPVLNDAYQQLLRIPASSPTVFFQDDSSTTEPDSNEPPFTPGNRDSYDTKVDSVGKNLHPLPWRNGDGATIQGPRNKDRERQNPDMIRPPSTDHGNMPNMRWSFADSHVRIEEGGWTRQTTVRELGTSKELAGVNMRLDAGVIRELHWHREAEWAYVLSGNVRVTALDLEGGSFIDDLAEGDLWYFPSGHPHSLQGLGPNGTEFLLIFDDGGFSEESTFLLTDWMGMSTLPPYLLSSHDTDMIFQHTPPNLCWPKTSALTRKSSKTFPHPKNTSSKARPHPPSPKNARPHSTPQPDASRTTCSPKPRYRARGAQSA